MTLGWLLDFALAVTHGFGMAAGLRDGCRALLPLSSPYAACLSTMFAVDCSIPTTLAVCLCDTCN